MTSATVTSKGQITIPLAIRQRLGLRAGDRVDFITESDGTIRLLSKKPDYEALREILHRPTQKPATIDEMKKAMAEYLRREDEREMRQK